MINPSAEGYLIQAAKEMFPAELPLTMENLKNWMSENMTEITERASTMQADFMKKFFKSEEMQSTAKKIVGDAVWHEIHKSTTNR